MTDRERMERILRRHARTTAQIIARMERAVEEAARLMREFFGVLEIHLLMGCCRCGRRLEQKDVRELRWGEIDEQGPGVLCPQCVRARVSGAPPAAPPGPAE